MTGGRGVDKVIEVGSGAFENSIRSTAFEGQISLVGRSLVSTPVSSGQIASPKPAPPPSLIDINVLFASVASIRTVAVGSRAQFIAMNKAISAHQMKPVIDRIFPFEAAHAAYQYYQAGKYFGKVIISHDQDY